MGPERAHVLPPVQGSAACTGRRAAVIKQCIDSGHDLNTNRKSKSMSPARLPAGPWQQPRRRRAAACARTSGASHCTRGARARCMVQAAHHVQSTETPLLPSFSHGGPVRVRASTPAIVRAWWPRARVCMRRSPAPRSRSSSSAFRRPRLTWRTTSSSATTSRWTGGRVCAYVCACVCEGWDNASSHAHARTRTQGVHGGAQLHARSRTHAHRRMHAHARAGCTRRSATTRWAWSRRSRPAAATCCSSKSPSCATPRRVRPRAHCHVLLLRVTHCVQGHVPHPKVHPARCHDGCGRVRTAVCCCVCVSARACAYTRALPAFPPLGAPSPPTPPLPSPPPHPPTHALMHTHAHMHARRAVAALPGQGQDHGGARRGARRHRVHLQGVDNHHTCYPETVVFLPRARPRCTTAPHCAWRVPPGACRRVAHARSTHCALLWCVRMH